MRLKPIALASFFSLLFFVILIQPTTAQTVFHYSYSSATVLTDIQDQSGSGNNATAGPLAALSTDVPTGVRAGDRSFDSSNPSAVNGTEAGAFTNANSLLDNDLIEAAGGFTYETWFKWKMQR